MPKSKEEVLREIEELQGELTARYEVTSDAERDLVLQADYALNGMTKDEKGLHELLRKMRVNKAAADPSVLGKDFYHTNWVTDDKGMISVTDQPIKAGSGNEALGQFRIGSGGITVNPEASIAVSRHAETTLPEIFNDRRAPEYTLRHEGSHRDSGWPEGWDRDRMEAANDGLTLIKYVDDKTLTEEQWVKALQDQGISLEDVAAIRGTKWDKSGAEKTNMSWEPDDDFAARQAEIDQASFNEDLGQVDVPVNEKIIQGVTPDNTAARNAVIDAENSLTPEDMSKQQIVDTNVDKMGLDDVSMTADEVSKAGGAATPDQIITLKRGGYTDKEINELRWPDRYHSDELELEHPAFQEPVTPTHMEVATGDPKMPVDPDKLHTDAVDSLAREANELENLDLEADDFEYKKLTPIQKFLSRRQKGRQVFVSAETALAGQGPAGQRGVKIIRDYHTARTQMEAEVLDDIMYFHQNPDIAQKAMEEAAMFDDLGGNVSADGLLYKSILERVRNMQNGAGGKVKYLYNYIPDMLHPDQKVAFKNWVIDNKNTPMLDGKSTVGEEFGRILDQIPESMDVTDENVLRQMKAFSEFERANGDNLPPELKEQYKSFFVQDPVEKLLMYTESNSKAYGQRVAMLEYQKKADALNKANPDKAPVTGNDLFLEDLHKDARAANPKNDRAGEDAQKFFKTMWDRETKPTSNKGLQTLRSMQVLTKMQMAGFTNSTQSVNTIGLNGAGNTAAAGLEVKRALGNPEEMNALLEKAGRWGMDLNPIADELKSSMGRDVIKERVTGKPQKGGGILERYADWMLTINQFKTVERINRLTAMLSTEKKVQGLVDKLNDGQSFSKAEQRYLQLLGISPEEIAAKGFDDEMFGRAVKQGVSLTQFETNPTQLPMFMTNGPIMDGIMTLQKFNVKQGEFLKEVILKEMGHGNFAPAARYLASAIPAGAANMWVKGVGITALVNLALAPFGVKAIQTKDPETALSEVNDVGSALNFATERIGYAGGFGYLDSVQQNWKYKKNLADFGMKMTGPIGSDIAMAFDMGDQLLNQDKNPDVGQNILAEMAKRAPVPFLNSTLRQAIKPYNPGDSTFYDIKDKIGLNSRNAEISEFTKLKKEGKDISESRVAAQIVGKVYDPSTGKIKDYISEKKRNEVLKVIEELGIDKYKALNYGKVQKNEVRKAGKMLTKEEKAIAGMGSEERDQYMRENGLEYSDMPTLVEYLRKKGQFY
jgi:hypothetical protein